MRRTSCTSSSKRTGARKSHVAETRGQPMWASSLSIATLDPTDRKYACSTSSIHRKKLEKWTTPAKSVSENWTRWVVVNWMGMAAGLWSSRDLKANRLQSKIRSTFCVPRMLRYRGHVPEFMLLTFKEGDPVKSMLEQGQFPEVAAAVRAQLDSIVREWIEVIHRILPGAHELTLAQVRNDLPEVLRVMADALECRCEEEFERLLNLAPLHGSTRFFEGFSAGEMMTE